MKTKKKKKSIEGIFEYGKESTLNAEELSIKNATVKISMHLNVDIYCKVKEFTKRTNGKYQTLLNDILKKYTDIYLAEQASAIRDDMAVFAKKYASR